MSQTNKSYSLSDLAEIAGGKVKGRADVMIFGVGTLDGATAKDISFLTNVKYKPQLATTKAGAVILPEKIADAVDFPAIVHANPHVAFAKIAQVFDTTPKLAVTVHSSVQIDGSASVGKKVAMGPNVVVGKDAVIGDNVTLGANTVVGEGAIIGDGVTIHPNVTLYHGVRLGKNVVIHSQSVIGSDGFGYANDKGTWLPIPQTGSVEIGDDTQIGAGVTIDRGALEDTVIGINVIIDDQVHIGHNCVIGDHSCICGTSGLAGSVHLGKHVVLGGGVGVNGHISICDNVQVTGFTMIISDITEPGVYSSGQPSMANRDWRKTTVRVRQIDSLFDRVKKLESQRNTERDK
ncbi:UDP-3-O-(3-hydroxymyristoyl)glucosamine N-acyltransferase [Alteromonas sp. ASW11-130]|uniref:UDP-3-O-(3-hydroxymyristoyl)glucosamine N-acyltransferase n=1 Tax=Alteromonas sp. ASW11-130 TaxID=3015775 RepID=UPI002241A27E|nr:UDP-3-O-(3-hydroxymyristoyl)glucosamine N-acyltransferase [Alteromonas sp. ASW11-130]MCW8093004.1 UDP-3-O-(3-hydroxymyristoyl)glucosamine N-acyltransferase [Alteromonas sp. ASW11-130]